MRGKYMALAMLGVMVFCLTLGVSSSTSAAEKPLIEIKAELKAQYGNAA